MEVKSQFAHLLASGKLVAWWNHGKELVRSIPEVREFSRFGKLDEVLRLLDEQVIDLTALGDFSDISEGGILSDFELARQMAKSVYVLCGQDTEEMRVLDKDEREYNLESMREEYDRSREKCYWSATVNQFRDLKNDVAAGMQPLIGLYKVRYYQGKLNKLGSYPDEPTDEMEKTRSLLEDISGAGIRTEDLAIRDLDANRFTAEGKVRWMLAITIARAVLWAATWKHSRFQQEREVRLIVINIGPPVRKGSNCAPSVLGFGIPRVQIANQPREPRHRLELPIVYRDFSKPIDKKKAFAAVRLIGGNFYNLPNVTDGRESLSRWQETIEKLELARGKSPLRRNKIVARPVGDTYDGL